MLITSRQNPRVKLAADLRDRRGRESQRRMLIDGVREIRRAISAGVRLAEVYVCPARCTSAECQALLVELPQAADEVLETAPPVFEKLAYGERQDGIVAVAQTPDTSLARLRLKVRPGEAPLVVVLEGVEKPGNLGAVLRTADGAGVSALLAADPRTDLFNPNAIRASLGSIFTIPVAAASTAECIAWLRAQGLMVFAARTDGRQAYTACDFRQGAAIVLGSEADGLQPAWSGDAATAITIPMLGAADSLNVSTAAAVLLYEARRQRGG